MKVGSPEGRRPERTADVQVRVAVERLKRGDNDGLGTLVKGHQTRALRAAYLITRDCASADGAVQSVFLSAYERANQLDLDIPFGPWFRRVVNDAVKGATRRERTVPSKKRLETR